MSMLCLNMLELELELNCLFVINDLYIDFIYSILFIFLCLNQVSSSTNNSRNIRTTLSTILLILSTSDVMLGFYKHE